MEAHVDSEYLIYPLETSLGEEDVQEDGGKANSSVRDKWFFFIDCWNMMKLCQKWLKVRFFFLTKSAWDTVQSKLQSSKADLLQLLAVN